MIIPSCYIIQYERSVYNWIGTDGFEVKSETERFTVVCPRCRQNLKVKRGAEPVEIN